MRTDQGASLKGARHRANNLNAVLACLVQGWYFSGVAAAPEIAGKLQADGPLRSLVEGAALHPSVTLNCGIRVNNRFTQTLLQPCLLLVLAPAVEESRRPCARFLPGFAEIPRSAVSQP